ncbi:patatin-like phospholipase family protein [Asticcacaulis sp. BYS171W]|uniref:Patatin-like phospholipase family protein n=1 Tax=Asticcacaulis aquaticus TaxID=2984212 RepID=A0ABT5HRR6_9CAUL|nr:patatin-like phospholipase family protein [Asticcacaulis aquaticus]MDC7682642.1 patatin-like phospholipase family protein [Asticcacaulis aquaticus]
MTHALIRSFKHAAAAIGIALSLSACVTLERPEQDYPKTTDFAPMGFKNARMSASDPSLPEKLEADARNEMKLSAKSRFDVLALSGGGADGAFGAGVLLGWTKRGDRPQFRMVTGVSTGALIAPFAFLGPDYDDKLKEAYTSGAANGLSKSRGLMSLFTPGILDTNALSGLVTRYVDEPMLIAIAREHAKGRRLLVATTNLDAQTGVLWDIGEIASEAVAAKSPARLTQARDLICQVLVASASVPGAFAPVMIDVERSINGGVQHFREMHVDGGVTLPFFVLPESMLNWTVPRDLISAGHIYVLVNGKITPQPAITTYNALNIMARSLDTLTKAQARTTLITLESFGQRNNMGVSFVSLPDEFAEGGLLAFKEDSMRRVFYYGFQLGASDKLWAKPEK